MLVTWSYLENHDTNVCLGLKVTLIEYRGKLSGPTDSEPEEQGDWNMGGEQLFPSGRQEQGEDLLLAGDCQSASLAE